MDRIIDYFMNSNGITYDQLEELTKIPKSTLYSIVKKETLNRPVEKILKFSSALNIPPSLIVEGDWISLTLLDYRSGGIENQHVVYWNMVTKHLLEEICHTMGADFGWIALRRKDDLVPGPIYGARYVPPSSVKEGITGYSVIHGVTVLVDDVSTDPKYKGIYEEYFSDTKSELCCPLTLYGKPIGVINIESTQKGRFTIDHAIELRVLAYQIARALACSVALSTEFREIGDRLNRLDYAGWKVLADSSLRKLHEEHQDTGYQFMSSVFMYDKDGLYCIAYKEPETFSGSILRHTGDLYSQRQLLPINSATGEAILSNREVYLRDVTAESHFSIAEKPGDMKSALIIPFPAMGTSKHSMGTLNIISLGHYTDFSEQKTAFRMYSELLSFIYSSAKIQRREVAFSVLRDTANRHSDEWFFDMLDKVMEALAEIIGAHEGSIFAEVGEKENEIRCIATTGLEGYEKHEAVYNEQLHGITYHIYRSKESIRFHSSKEEIEVRNQLGLEKPRYREKLEEAPEQESNLSFLGVPITLGDRSIGALRVVSKKRGVIFTEDDRRLLNDIAGILAPAIMHRNVSFLAKASPS